MYQALRTARTESVPIRTLNYHVRLWGNAHPEHPPLVLLHGWMDVGASYQFVVDAFTQGFAAGRQIIAPDWRGFGHSRLAAPCDSYPFVDYLADLDQLLNHYAGDRPVDLVGHSMGGNVAMMYAGARPARIHRLVNLEGFGLPATQPAQAPGRFAQWMDEIDAFKRGEMALKAYDSADDVAQRLMKTNARIGQDKARWLARHWAHEDDQGRWHILGDAAHKITNPLLYRADEALALYEAITAPVLSVHASDDSLARWQAQGYSLQKYLERLTHVRNAGTAVVQDAGHMLHHDQPQAVAALIENFVAGRAPA